MEEVATPGDRVKAAGSIPMNGSSERHMEAGVRTPDGGVLAAKAT